MLIVHDVHAETAGHRRDQLAAIVTGRYLVSSTTSRNRLLADIADARAPVLALIDLVDSDVDRNHRLGDRIIMTIARNARLRQRCIPVALTFHSGIEIHRAAYLAGARAIVNAKVLGNVSEHDALRGLFERLETDHDWDSRHPRWRPHNDAARSFPIIGESSGTDPPAETYAAEEFLRWFDQTLQPWTLHMLEAIANEGDDQTSVVEYMTVLQRKRVVDTVEEGTWRNRHTKTWKLLMQRGKPPPDTAAEFLSHIRADLIVDASRWRLPAFDLLQRARRAPDDLIAWAAFISDEDQVLVDRVCRADARIEQPAPKPRDRIAAACAEAAKLTGSPSAKALFDIAGFVAHSVHDAKTDYEHRPTIEISHRLRRLTIPTYVTHAQRDANGLVHLAIEHHERLTIDTNTTIRLDGMTADEWGDCNATPLAGTIRLLARAAVEPALITVARRDT